jgi:hypothetical protein
MHDDGFRDHAHDPGDLDREDWLRLTTDALAA